MAAVESAGYQPAYVPFDSCGKCQPIDPLKLTSASSPLLTTATVAPDGTHVSTVARMRTTSLPYSDTGSSLDATPAIGTRGGDATTRSMTSSSSRRATSRS